MALTDEGVSVAAPGRRRSRRAWSRWIADPPVMAGTGNFLGDLDLVKDLNGDGIPDLLLPAQRRPRRLPRPSGGKGLARRAASRVPVPGRGLPLGGRPGAPLSAAAVQDVTGDGRPDLVFRDPVKRWRSCWVARNGGQGRFSPAVEVVLGTGDPKAPNPVWMGDLEGNGLAEVVFRQSLDDPKQRLDPQGDGARPASPRAGSPSAGSASDLAPEKAPYRTFDITG